MSKTKAIQLVIVLALLGSTSLGLGGCDVLKRLHGGRSVSITFVGDTGLDAEGREFATRNGYDASFAQVRQLIGHTDALVGNLETPISDRIFAETAKPPIQRTAVVKTFRDFGFTAFGLANNHEMDFGAQGLAETMRALADQGMAVFGAGSDETQARTAYVVAKNGVRVGILGYCQSKASLHKSGSYAGPGTAGLALLEAEKVRQDVESLRKSVDQVVVVIHWVGNYKRLEKRFIKAARAAAKAKPDLIIGHGPHVVWPVGEVEGVPVLYSIGNFVWFNSGGGYRNHKVRDLGYGMVAAVDFTKSKIQEIRLTPVNVRNREVHFVPRGVPVQESEELFKRLLKKFPGRYRVRNGVAILNPS